MHFYFGLAIAGVIINALGIGLSLAAANLFLLLLNSSLLVINVYLAWYWAERL